ncbi:hypothetical protein BDK51DRAFT_48923 [Blyttiomyces helicus]|uniref:Cyclic nucleotide-binding domain-containing protein n=1 Tax=Blyttiomyces helicus TaxID=388810 RepID=A0A4P9W720_9FUNG|nr:hypothetical protein BDK51DRAFT_48923 [Blyttiomyces helicus]|eukprot:RKO86798.1 hypothetical protein BDK51DRAFT_48923 [Blyttiomyces helicus]
MGKVQSKTQQAASRSHEDDDDDDDDQTHPPRQRSLSDRFRRLSRPRKSSVVSASGRKRRPDDDDTADSPGTRALRAERSNGEVTEVAMESRRASLAGNPSPRGSGTKGPRRVSNPDASSHNTMVRQGGAQQAANSGSVSLLWSPLSSGSGIMAPSTSPVVTTDEPEQSRSSVLSCWGVEMDSSSADTDPLAAGREASARSARSGGDTPSSDGPQWGRRYPRSSKVFPEYARAGAPPAVDDAVAVASQAHISPDGCAADPHPFEQTPYPADGSAPDPATSPAKMDELTTFVAFGVVLPSLNEQVLVDDTPQPRLANSIPYRRRWSLPGNTLDTELEELLKGISPSSDALSAAAPIDPLARSHAASVPVPSTVAGFAAGLVDARSETRIHASQPTPPTPAPTSSSTDRPQRPKPRARRMSLPTPDTLQTRPASSKLAVRGALKGAALVPTPPPTTTSPPSHSIQPSPPSILRSPTQPPPPIGGDIARELPLFELKLKKSMTPAIFIKGEFIIRKHEIGRQMYFLSKGTVEVVSADGMTQYSIINRGSFFGRF